MTGPAVLTLLHSARAQICPGDGTGILPDLATCEVRRGPVGRDVLSRLGKRAPAVLLSCLAVRSIEPAPGGEVRITDEGVVSPQGSTDADLQVGAFVVTRDAPQLPRDEAALAIVEGVLQWLPFWKRPDVKSGPPRGVRADNLFSEKLDGAGIAIWAITWSQKLRLDSDAVEPAGGLVPAELYSSGAPLPAEQDPHERLVPAEESA